VAARRGARRAAASSRGERGAAAPSGGDPARRPPLARRRGARRRTPGGRGGTRFILRFAAISSGDCFGNFFLMSASASMTSSDVGLCLPLLKNELK